MHPILMKVFLNSQTPSRCDMILGTNEDGWAITIMAGNLNQQTHATTQITTQIRNPCPQAINQGLMKQGINIVLDPTFKVVCLGKNSVKSSKSDDSDVFEVLLQQQTEEQPPPKHIQAHSKSSKSQLMPKLFVTAIIISYVINVC